MTERMIQAAIVRADMALAAAWHIARVAVPVAVALGLVVLACYRLWRRG